MLISCVWQPRPYFELDYVAPYTPVAISHIRYCRYQSEEIPPRGIIGVLMASPTRSILLTAAFACRRDYQTILKDMGDHLEEHLKP